jgi:hypothetical protein
MPEASQILAQLRRLEGRIVRYHGLQFRLTEVLEDPPEVVLEPLERGGAIVTDSYGHPSHHGTEFTELRIFDDAGEVSAEIAHLLVESLA